MPMLTTVPLVHATVITACPSSGTRAFAETGSYSPKFIGDVETTHFLITVAVASMSVDACAWAERRGVLQIKEALASEASRGRKMTR
jgi:hypothetical protein